MAGSGGDDVMQRPAASQWQGRVVLAAVWIAAFLVSFDYTAITVALPSLAADFDVGTSRASWASLSYMLAMVALTLVAGPAIERVGYRRALIAALLIFAGGSLAAIFTAGLWPLVAARGLQGVGASVMFVIGPVLIKRRLPADVQTKAFAVFSIGPMAGLAVGPALGGELTYLFGWRAVFVANLPLVAAALALALAIGRDRVPSGEGVVAESRPPLPNAGSAITAAAIMASVVVVLNQGAEWGWASRSILGLSGLAVVLAAAFLVLEARTRRPLVDRRLFRVENFSASACVFFMILMVFGGMVFVLPFFFEWLWKFDTDTVGHILVTQPLATITASVVLGFLLTGAGRRAVALVGIALVTCGVLCYALATVPLGLALPLAGLGLIGIGAGLYYPAVLQLGIANAPVSMAASASGLQTTIRVLAQMLGVVIFETIFSGLFADATNASRAAAATGETLARMESAFHVVFWVAACVAALALVPALKLTAPAARPPRLVEEGTAQ